MTVENTIFKVNNAMETSEQCVKSFQIYMVCIWGIKLPLLKTTPLFFAKPALTQSQQISHNVLVSQLFNK